VSLGIAPVAAGDTTDVVVALMPPPEGTMMTSITPTVWPMLHMDTDADGQYRYLMIPGVDLPMVYNGAVATIPVPVSGEMVVPMDMMTAEAPMEMDMTEEMDMSGEVTPEVTEAASG
jgi:hypothetical protein